MKYSKYIFWFAISIFISAFYACNQNKQTETTLSEGIIEYKTTVVDKNNPLASFAPSRATVFFKNNNLHVDMNVMGVLKTSFISNSINNTLIQTVDFFDIKQACIQNENELGIENKDYQINFEETNETKIIAGYTCKKVNATMVNNPENTFSVYYTNDLGKDSINFLSPYKAIKGMLMEYRLKKLGLELCFTATEVKKNTIGSDIFEIPSKYKVVTRSEMNKLFEDFQK